MTLPRHTNVQQIILKIDEIDLPNRAVHGRDKTNVLVQATFRASPAGILRIPQQNERWVASRIGLGQWNLESRLDSADQQTWAEDNLQPGDVLIEGDNIHLEGNVIGVSGGVTGISSGSGWGSTNTGQVIHSGAVTPLTFDVWTSAPGNFPPVAFSGNPVGNFTVTAWRVHIDLTVTFPAAAYDRYIEIAQVGQIPGEPIFTPIRARSQITPDGDSLSVSGVVVGSPFSPSPLQLNVFQASGVDRTVQRYTSMYGWPIALPSETWT